MRSIRTLQAQSQVRWLVAATLLVSACGRGGSGGSGGADPAPVNPPPLDEPGDYSLRTNVPMATMGYDLGGIKACLNTVSSGGLPGLATPLAIDADLGEWAGIVGVADDPIGDAAPAADLTYVAVAGRGEDVAVAFGPRASASAVYLEVGGMVTRKGVLVSEVRRLFKMEADQLFDFEAGAFHAVTPELGRTRFASSGGEVLLSRRLVGDVVGYPLWWVRAFTRVGDDASRLADSTTAAYFPSLIETDEPKFSIKTCREWSGRPQPIDLVQIRDTRTKDKTLALDVAAARVHELARLAFDASVALLGEQPIATGKLTALATANRVGALVDKTGSGLELDAGARPYRAFVVDARALDPKAVDYFPQGQVVRTMVAQLLEMDLNRWQPAATYEMVTAWRVALEDHLVRRFLGQGYWLDSYRNALAGALAATPLTGDQSPSGDHASGFGRLAAMHLSAADLVKTWRSSAAPSVEALRAKMLELAPSGARRRLLARLWSGWLAAESFDPEFSPVALGDTDLDGVPDHVERLHGTATDAADSDHDGWTDLGELVFGSDAQVADDTPSHIMPDGEFGDWQQLLPKRLGVDRGKSGTCPKAADIEFFAAIATRDELVVGAVAHEYWENEPAARWEVELDLPTSNQQLLVAGVGGSREYVVRQVDAPSTVLRRYERAMPVARRTIEWAVDRRALGLETYLDVPAVVRLRVRTLFTKDGRDLLCDETDWFAPSISEK